MEKHKEKSHFSTELWVSNGILWYNDFQNKKRFWDVFAFRPCLFLEEGKKYAGDITLGTETVSGEDVTYPEELQIDSKKYFNIR